MKIAIVEDEPTYARDLEIACSGHQVVLCENYAEARSKLAPDMNLIIIDCCLKRRVQGSDYGGITLAETICADREFKVPIWMYTFFRAPNTEVGQRLPALFDSHRAEVGSTEPGRRIINPDIDGCVKAMIASELASKALNRLESLIGQGWICP
jgi:hypothetical protein